MIIQIMFSSSSLHLQRSLTVSVWCWGEKLSLMRHLHQKALIHQPRLPRCGTFLHPCSWRRCCIRDFSGLHVLTHTSHQAGGEMFPQNLFLSMEEGFGGESRPQRCPDTSGWHKGAGVLCPWEQRSSALLITVVVATCSLDEG